MTSRILNPSARVCALGAILCFVPVAATFFVGGGAGWADYPGIIFHLFVFLLVARLPAPEWARAAGYGWLVIDTTVGAMTLNGVGAEIFTPMRLGGHLFAGLWVVAASFPARPSIRITGVLTGLYLFGFTFVAPQLPMKALAPASILMIVWLALIAWNRGSGAPAAAATAG